MGRIKAIVRVIGLILATIILLGWITVAHSLDLFTNIIVLILAGLFLAITFQE